MLLRRIPVRGMLHDWPFRMGHQLLGCGLHKEPVLQGGGGSAPCSAATGLTAVNQQPPYFTPPTPPAPNSGQCSDVATSCTVWASSPVSGCTNPQLVQFMMQSCARTCNSCSARRGDLRYSPLADSRGLLLPDARITINAEGAYVDSRGRLIPMPQDVAPATAKLADTAAATSAAPTWTVPVLASMCTVVAAALIAVAAFVTVRRRNGGAAASSSTAAPAPPVGQSPRPVVSERSGAVEASQESAIRV